MNDAEQVAARLRYGPGSNCSARAWSPGIGPEIKTIKVTGGVLLAHRPPGCGRRGPAVVGVPGLGPSLVEPNRGGSGAPPLRPAPPRISGPGGPTLHPRTELAARPSRFGCTGHGSPPACPVPAERRRTGRPFG